MCGIFAICHSAECQQQAAKFDAAEARSMSKRQCHRGPDYHGIYQHPINGNLLVHERLAIMDLKCVQPIQGREEDHQVIHNGEIYNFLQLHESELSQLPFKTTCDSEVIIHLYDKLRHPAALCNALDGVFAFALIYGDEFVAARDPIGVKPFYWGIDKEGRHFFASEMKVIEEHCGAVEMHAFPPGHYWTPSTGFVRYYQPLWFHCELATHKADLVALKHSLIDATHKRLVSDAPIGVLLSGGLDSSLVSAIAARRMRQLNLPLRSFSIGLDASAPDLVAARQIAQYLGTQHHEFHFTIEEGLANLRQLVWHLESYDVTSIRASTPMFFLSKNIAQLGIKVVLSGEGADEVFGGYLYFHQAPSDEEFQLETIRRVTLLSTSDCLRADKSCMAHSLEARVPFLDKSFLDTAMLIHPSHRRPQPQGGGGGGRRVEKWILRKAFEAGEEGEEWIPSEILWRQKEQFSDGVGYGWIDALSEHCAAQVTDEEMATAANTFPHNTPTTKEAYHIRRLFHEHYPSDAAAKTVLKWVPKWQDNEDPSGRASTIHEKSKGAEGNDGVTVLAKSNGNIIH